jgi:hypothetical protein
MKYKNKMSPNSFLMWNSDSGLLEGFDGENAEAVMTLSYSNFEEYMDESITPSMYHWMTTYIITHHTKDDLWDIARGDGISEDLISDAVHSYFEEPINDRIELHEQTIGNLKSALAIANAKESAAMNWILTDDDPFDRTSPIYKEMCDFVRSLVEKYRVRSERLAAELHEEEQWRGGHEAGASDMETDIIMEGFDPMEE